MPVQKGRDLLLKIGGGESPTEIFSTIGAARTATVTVNNNPVDATTMADNGIQSLAADAGVQSMQIKLDGLFRDQAAEETLRAAAFTRVTRNYELLFPNGDKYAAAFVVESYARTGSHDGLEGFSVSLLRSGDGTFTAGA
jgi:TP901-1 family phage major tail protein